MFAQASSDVIQVSVAGLASFGGTIAAAIVAAAKFYIGYLKDRDEKDRADRVIARDDLLKIRAEMADAAKQTNDIQLKTATVLTTLAERVERMNAARATNPER